MSDKSNTVDIGPIEAGNAVEQEYWRALFVHRFDCAPLNGEQNRAYRDAPQDLHDEVMNLNFEKVMEVKI